LTRWLDELAQAVARDLAYLERASLRHVVVLAVLPALLALLVGAVLARLR
jgi:hypothetical protein